MGLVDIIAGRPVAVTSRGVVEFGSLEIVVLTVM
jgi:hypothetical protein